MAAATCIVSWSEHLIAGSPNKDATVVQSECILIDETVEHDPTPTTNSGGGLCDAAAEETTVTAAPINPLEANGGSRMNNHAPSNNTNSISKPFMKPPTDIISAPYNYITTLPSKNVRDTFIDAFNNWIKIPESSISSIKAIIGMLHHSSLMLDDIEDSSKLRRGNPAVHKLFGTSQTINSANYVFVNAFAELHNLCSPNAPRIFTEEVKNILSGQALDLHWKYHTHCPTVDEYMMMVDNKTGGLFRLCVRLMQAEANISCPDSDLDYFTTQLGRYFQVRDDYQNLTSTEYTNQKGFCEDLDEGKISLPLIYCITGKGLKQDMIRGIFQHKFDGQQLPMEMKEFILAHMHEVGSLGMTLSLLRDMQQGMEHKLHQLETQFGSKNATLHAILNKLKV